MSDQPLFVFVVPKILDNYIKKTAVKVSLDYEHLKWCGIQTWARLRV